MLLRDNRTRLSAGTQGPACLGWWAHLTSVSSQFSFLCLRSGMFSGPDQSHTLTRKPLCQWPDLALLPSGAEARRHRATAQGRDMWLALPPPHVQA